MYYLDLGSTKEFFFDFCIRYMFVLHKYSKIVAVHVLNPCYLRQYYNALVFSN